MALHQRTHPVFVDGCFGCKVIGLNFATVPGAYRDTVSDARIDKDSLEEQFGDAFDKDKVLDNQSDARKAIAEFNEATK